MDLEAVEEYGPLRLIPAILGYDSRLPLTRDVRTIGKALWVVRRA